MHGPVAYESVVDSALLRPKLGPSETLFLYLKLYTPAAINPKLGMKVTKPASILIFHKWLPTSLCSHGVKSEDGKPESKAPLSPKTPLFSSNAAAPLVPYRPGPRCDTLDDLLQTGFAMPGGPCPRRL